MTPEEKALIDARREGYAARVRQEYPGWGAEWVAEEAARAFPYPPEPEIFTDKDGTQWRFYEGAYQWRDAPEDEWRHGLYSVTPADVRGLYALLPLETTETTP